MTLEPEPQKHWFRVHFQGGDRADYRAVHPLVAEKKARADYPDRSIKKIKRLYEEKPDAR